MTDRGARRSCVVLGGRGFVGSAFVEHARRQGWEVVAVGRDEWDQHAGRAVDVVVCAAGNSKKRLAEADPAWDREASVDVVERALDEFPCGHFVLASTVDVYPDPGERTSTIESTRIEPSALSAYGHHKRLAEIEVARGHDAWLVLRLAQMVGPGLAKGPLYDLVHGQPRWVAPESTHHYLSTASVARIAFELVDRGIEREVFNVVGRGNVAVERLAALLPEALRKQPLGERPRAGNRVEHYDIDTSQIEEIVDLPDSWSEAADYVRAELVRP